MSWLPTAFTGAIGAVVLVGFGLLVWGLLQTGSDSDDISLPDDGDGDAISLTDSDDISLPDDDISLPDDDISLPDDVLVPQRFTFAPGETISADGPGVFYLDLETGAAEGWILETENVRAFSVFSISADGAMVLYTCRDHDAEGQLGPCDMSAPDSPLVWYLLDTESGERTQLPPGMEYQSLSPDGSMLVGETEDGLALASVSAPGDVRPLGVGPGSATWSPDSSSIVVRGAGGTFLAHADNADLVQLHVESVRSVAWAPDGSRVALVVSREEATSPDSPSEIFVFDDDGNQLSSRPTGWGPVNPRWSADSKYLAVQVRVAYKPEPELGPTFFRLDVFGDTGEPLYRIPGAIACAGQVWTADSSKLMVGSYGFGGFLVEPAAGTLTRLIASGEPHPSDPALAIRFDFNSFSTVVLSTGEATLLAETTVKPSWFSDHEPRFAGERIVFVAPHGGHGGCAVCCSPQTPPLPLLEYPPFDD